jgi:L-Ala-D/L-Glu epimerase
MQLPLTSRIQSIRLTPFDLPLRETMVLASATIASQQHVLVEVEDEDGIVGLAEAIARPHIYGETVTSIIGYFRDFAQPLLVEYGPNEALARLAGVAANNTARGAVEIALVDLELKRLGLSARDCVAPGLGTSAQTSGMLGIGQAERIAAQAVELRETYGFAAWKMKVGLNIADDIATVNAVRSVVGSEDLIYVDANHGFSVGEALRFWKATRDADVAFIEEPCPPTHGRRRLVSAGVEILSDEFATDATAVASQLAAGETTIAGIKTARTGFRESGVVRDVAKVLGARVLVGSQGDSGIGTMAALAFALEDRTSTELPGEFAFVIELAEDVLDPPLQIENGRVGLRGGLGLGVEIDRDKLNRLAERVGG